MNLATELENMIKSDKHASEHEALMTLAKEIERLRAEGLIKRPEYTLPMADTIGRGLFSIKNSPK